MKFNFLLGSFSYNSYLQNYSHTIKNVIKQNPNLLRQKPSQLRYFELYEFPAFSSTKNTSQIYVNIFLIYKLKEACIKINFVF